MSHLHEASHINRPSGRLSRSILKHTVDPFARHGRTLEIPVSSDATSMPSSLSWKKKKCPLSVVRLLRKAGSTEQTHTTCTHIRRDHTAGRIRDKVVRIKRAWNSVPRIRALVASVLLQADQVKKHLCMLLGEEAALHSLEPLRR